MNQRVALFFLSICLFAWPVYSQVAAPRAGLVRYNDGAVYPVYGLPGNYLLGPQTATAVEALASSDAGSLSIRRGLITLVDRSLTPVGSFEADGSGAIPGIDTALNSAIVWLPAKQTVAHWTGNAFASITVPNGSVAGKVVSITKSSPDIADFLIKNEKGEVEEATVSLTTGSVLSRGAVPGGVGTFLRQGSSFLSLQANVLVISAASGALQKLPIRADDLTCERISSTAIHLHSVAGDRDWVLHFTGEQASLFELPVPARGAAR